MELSKPQGPFQPQLAYEHFEDAMHDLVMVLGGFKKVGPSLWPEKTQDEATQLLRHCLNRGRREKLDSDQIFLLLRRAKAAGFHGAKHFIDEATEYCKTPPIDPADKVAELQREFIASVQRSERVLQELKQFAGIAPPAAVASR